MDSIGLMIPPASSTVRGNGKRRARKSRRGGQAGGQKGGFLPLLLAGLAGSVLPKLLGGRRRGRRGVRK